MTAKKVKVKRPRAAKSMTVWRVDHIGPTGRTSPFGGPRKGPSGQPVFDPTPGVYAVDDVRNSVNHLKSLEHAQRWHATHEKAVTPAAAALSRQDRLCVVEGSLHDPSPAAPLRGGGRLVTITADGRAGIGAAVSMVWGVEVAALAVQGDPPGTWRGSAFTPARIVIELWPEDPPDLYADPAVEWVTIERTGDPADRLSARIGRYARSGRTDGRWWTA